MKERIIPHDLTGEFYISENCFITELSNSQADPHLSIARARVKPGESTKLHRLRETAERYYILEGKGLVEIGNLKPQVVGAGDIVLIPPLCPQRITNSGSTDLIFLAICTPRFSEEAYQEVEVP